MRVTPNQAPNAQIPTRSSSPAKRIHIPAHAQSVKPLPRTTNPAPNQNRTHIHASRPSFLGGVRVPQTRHADCFCLSSPPHRSTAALPLPRHAHRGPPGTGDPNRDKDRRTHRHPALPELRNCPAPSAPRILEIFNNIQRHHLVNKHDEIVQTFQPELTPTAATSTRAPTPSNQRLQHHRNPLKWGLKARREVRNVRTGHRHVSFEYQDNKNRV